MSTSRVASDPSVRVRRGHLPALRAGRKGSYANALPPLGREGYEDGECAGYSAATPSPIGQLTPVPPRPQ
jgi:hypothetical protein